MRFSSRTEFDSIAHRVFKNYKNNQIEGGYAEVEIDEECFRKHYSFDPDQLAGSDFAGDGAVVEGFLKDVMDYRT